MPGESLEERLERIRRESAPTHVLDRVARIQLLAERRIAAESERAA